MLHNTEKLEALKMYEKAVRSIFSFIKEVGVTHVYFGAEIEDNLIKFLVKEKYRPGHKNYEVWLNNVETSLSNALQEQGFSHIKPKVITRGD